MGSTSTVRGLLKSTMAGPAWHGTPIMDCLKLVSAHEAHARPVPGAHSMWEILHHMDAWQLYAIRALHGEQMDTLSDEDDWPEVAESTPTAWGAAVKRFEENNQALQEMLEDVDDERLTQNVGGRDYTFKFLLHGIVHHNLYHAGQIAMLLRAVDATATE